MHGSWNFGLLTLKKLARAFGWEVDAGSSLFEVAFQCVSKALPNISLNFHLACLQKRKAFMTMGLGTLYEEFLQLGD
eukprot:5318310-Alexandrium_andersonii.AAC.1